MLKATLRPLVFALAMTIVFGIAGCKKKDETPSPPDGNLKLKYITNTGENLWFAPIIANEVMAVIGFESNVKGIKKETGEILWTFTPPDGKQPWLTGGFSDGTTFYIGVSGAEFYALDALTGETKWKTNVGIDVTRQGVVHEGTLYLPTAKYWPPYLSAYTELADVVKLDAATGKELGRFTTDNYMVSTLSLENGVIYVGGSNNKPHSSEEGGTHTIHAIDAATMTEKWKQDGSDGMTKTIIAKNGVLNYIGYDDFVVGLTMDTGKEIWRTNTGNWVRGLSYADGVTYFGAANNKVFAINQQTGGVIWKYTLLYPRILSFILAPPIIQDGVVYFVNRDSRLFSAVNASNGELIWTYQTELTENSHGAPVLDGNMFYMSGFDGRVFAYELVIN